MSPMEPTQTHTGGSLSLRAKVLGSYLGVLVIFGTVLGFALVQMAGTRARLSAIASGYVMIQREVEQISAFPAGYALARESVVGERYHPSLDQFYLDQKESHMRMASVYAYRLQAKLEDPVELSALREVQAQMELVDQLLGSFSRSQERLLICREQADDSCLTGTEEELLLVRDQLTDEVSVLRTKVENRINNALESAGETQIRASRQLLWLSSTAIVLAGMMLLLVHLSLRPIDRLIRGTQRIAEGHYEERVLVDTHDEVGKLADAFNRMGASLAEREAELLKMERLATIGRMSAQVAHEIRNPLNSMGLNAELLSDEVEALDEPARTEAREILGEVQAEIDRLAQVTETYLTLARMPSLEFNPGDIGSVARRVEAFMHDELNGAGVEVALDIAPGLPPVAVDENQLRQALMNLLRNGIEALPDGGTMRIGAAVAGEQLELTVHDDGPGIAPDVRDTIFDPFVTTKERGTGLGLAITRQIIEGHGGKIFCESEPGRGTTFRILLEIA